MRCAWKVSGLSGTVKDSVEDWGIVEGSNSWSPMAEVSRKRLAEKVVLFGQKEHRQSSEIQHRLVDKVGNIRWARKLTARYELWL